MVKAEDTWSTTPSPRRDPRRLGYGPRSCRSAVERGFFNWLTSREWRASLNRVEAAHHKQCHGQTHESTQATCVVDVRHAHQCPVIARFKRVAHLRPRCVILIGTAPNSPASRVPLFRGFAEIQNGLLLRNVTKRCMGHASWSCVRQVKQRTPMRSSSFARCECRSGRVGKPVLSCYSLYFNARISKFRIAALVSKVERPSGLESSTSIRVETFTSFNSWSTTCLSSIQH